MKTRMMIVGLFLLAGGAHAAIVDEVQCTLQSNEMNGPYFSARGTVAMLRRDLNSSPGSNVRDTIGQISLGSASVTKSGQDFTVDITLSVHHRMILDASGNVLRAGQLTCITPAFRYSSGSGPAAECPTPVGHDPLDGFTHVQVADGVPNFDSTSLFESFEIPHYGKASMSCEYKGTTR